jgi:1,4-dihydroxy-6-naphthoate synthase
MLVTLEEPPADPESIKAWLQYKRIAVPGEKTSAYLALRLFAGKVPTLTVPFDEIFSTVKRGKADVGLVIHEGQITYPGEGFQLALDLGNWWKSATGLPLPLGGNVIRKDIPSAIQKEVSEIMKQSIAYGLSHRRAGVEHSMPLARGLDRDQADRFIGMYVNDFTLDYGAVGKTAIREFLASAARNGLIPQNVQLEFVE